MSGTIVVSGTGLGIDELVEPLQEDRSLTTEVERLTAPRVPEALV